ANSALNGLNLPPAAAAAAAAAAANHHPSMVPGAASMGSLNPVAAAAAAAAAASSPLANSLALNALTNPLGPLNPHRNAAYDYQQAAFYPWLMARQQFLAGKHTFSLFPFFSFIFLLFTFLHFSSFLFTFLHF